MKTKILIEVDDYSDQDIDRAYEDREEKYQDMSKLEYVKNVLLQKEWVEEHFYQSDITPDLLKVVGFSIDEENFYY